MNSVTPRPLVVKAGTAAALWHPGIRTEVLLTGVQSANKLGVLHQTHYVAEQQVRPRAHAQDLATYIVKGQMSFQFDAASKQVAKAGSFVSIPRGTPVSITTDEVGTEAIVFSVPAGLDQIFLLTSPRAAENDDAPPSDLKWPDMKRVQAVSEQYGLRHIAKLPDKSKKSVTTLMHAAQALVTNVESAPAYWTKPAIPESWTILASSGQTDSRYTVTEIKFTKGNAARPLKFVHHDETYFVLGGKATYLLNRTTETVEKGDFVFIPAGTVFGLRVDSEDWFHAIAIHTPAGIIEGSLDMIPNLKIDGSKVVRDKVPSEDEFEAARPELDPADAMARMQEIGLSSIAVADPLK